MSVPNGPFLVSLQLQRLSMRSGTNDELDRIAAFYSIVFLIDKARMMMIVACVMPMVMIAVAGMNE